MENNYFRTRINTKQTAKGEWYIDFTSEEGDTTNIPPEVRANRHLEYLRAIEKVMIADNRKLAGGF